MTGAFTDAQLSSVTTLLEQRPPALGAAWLVSIDGPAGSGKTTLASEISDRLERSGSPSAVLHMDDFYEGWSGLDATGELERRVLDQTLCPLAAHRVSRWQRYDWKAERFAEWRELPPPEVLILEGCGSGALAYASYITVLVWVEATRGTRLARGVQRDGADVVPRWLRWIESETRHFAANDTRSRADLRFSTG